LNHHVQPGRRVAIYAPPDAGSNVSLTDSNGTIPYVTLTEI